MSAANTRLQNTPCRKSVTITVTWPPRKMKNSAVDSIITMNTRYVSNVPPAKAKCAGSPMRLMRKRALMPGNTP